ncbi:M50 family metallopeptidase [Cellulomonas endophytica]|uniref:M50 family metallopeptidase n=1 Tax=Cellulomonas endophytica TaxID=2494735 RepID=UPI001012A1E3|nr:RIP metalloprotease [Cellulomonas endophytica]
MDYLVGVVVVVVVLLASIALHEVGHMVPAKRFGVRVSQYMVGFGPTLWSRTRGETEYGVKAIPAGGYVRLVGMYPTAQAVGDPPVRSAWSRLAADARAASAEEIHPGEDHRAFYRLSTPKKLVVMLGGPVMNLLIAAVLLTVVYVGIGVPAASTTVASVADCVLPADATACTAEDPPGPAAEAGLRAGDRVVAFDGTPVDSWDALSALIREAGGRADVPLVVERDGARVTLDVTPAVAERPVLAEDGTTSTATVGYLGVSAATVTERVSPLAVPGLLAERTWGTAEVVATLPARFVDLAERTFTGQERDLTSIVGPVGITRFGGEIAAADAGAALEVASLLELLAGLNIALFVFNLLPLPPLDGGHVVAALWEGASRRLARVRGRERLRPFDTARLVPVAYGVFLLMGGMGLVVLYADVVNPVRLG